MYQIRIIRQEEIDDALHELFGGKKSQEQPIEPTIRQSPQPQPETMRQPVSYTNTNQVQRKSEFSYFRAGFVVLIGAVGGGYLYLNSPAFKMQFQHIFDKALVQLEALMTVEPFVMLIGLAVILLLVGFVTKK